MVVYAIGVFCQEESALLPLVQRRGSAGAMFIGDPVEPLRVGFSLFTSVVFLDPLMGYAGSLECVFLAVGFSF
jgi:hypothetical protein